MTTPFHAAAPSAACRALAVPAGALATMLTMHGGTASLWSVTALLMPSSADAILGLSIVVLVGGIAAATAQATRLERCGVVSLAFAGGAIAMLLAPLPIAGISPLVALLAAGHLVAARLAPAPPRAANDNPRPVSSPTDYWLSLGRRHDRIARPIF